MIKYPTPYEDFTIYDFRENSGVPCATYYLHVVNDETRVCHRQCEHFSFDAIMKKYDELSKECKSGWHSELTVGLGSGEIRSRLK